MSGRLRIAVCLRVAADTAVRSPELDPVAGALRPESIRHAPDPIDLAALAKALLLRSALGGDADIHALFVGPASLADHLRECLAMGADDAHRIDSDAVPPGDGIAIGAVLAGAVEALCCELVLCGERSKEGMHGVVGPAIAHALGWPFLRVLVQIDVLAAERAIEATQRLERGDRMVWRCRLPAVCAVAPGIAVPKYVPVFRRIVAKRRPIDRLELGDERQRVDRVLSAFGTLRVDKLALPRIRPKRVEAPAANLSPAERLKALRSGGAAKQQSGGAAKPQGAAGERLRGHADVVAGRIVEFLAEKGFVR